MACHLVLTKAEYAVFTGDDEEAAKGIFTKIDQACRESLFAYIRVRVDTRHDAEDTVQEVFAKAWENRKTLRDRCRVCSWLHGIAMREWVNWLRRKPRGGEIPRCEGPSPDEQVSDNEIIAIMERFRRRRLTQMEREMWRRRFDEDQSIEQIASALEIPQQKVYEHLYRAREVQLVFLEKRFDPDNEKRLHEAIKDSFPDFWQDWAGCRFALWMSRDETADCLRVSAAQFPPKRERKHYNALRSTLGPELRDIVWIE